jgi:hypothetical protein
MKCLYSGLALGLSCGEVRQSAFGMQEAVT